MNSGREAGRILENQRQAEKLAADAKARQAVIRMFDPEFDARAIGPQARAPHGDGPRNIDQRKGIEAGAARSQPTASKPSPTRQCLLPSSTL